MRKLVFVILLQAIVYFGKAQELMPLLDDSQVTELIDLPGVVTLNDGSKIAGTVNSAFLSKGLLTDITLKLQDGETKKFRAGEIESARVRVKSPTVFSVVDNDGNPLKKVIYTQVVFERPFKTEKEGKDDLRQLLNPVFDSRVKIFALPASGGRKSLVLRSGAPEPVIIESLIFVKGSEIFYVKEKSYKASYKKDFASVFGDCPKLLETVPADQILYSGIASHALLYDHYCGTAK